ncbi:GATOR complex protein NPRL2-like [Mya arenaria]|uniref:GATOR complex protein NPRL2-like n=1 Tax=Mya arenaria TaxID=6604 RepID=UPI0022E09BC5|nr:GATOR complex protein NPRL2-like [Mya arenaria]XP_052791105.1 GATOR complex protein NPRL2-like [Mya arenaria]
MAGKSSEKIKCIFFSEFHITAGPKITFQVPEGYVSKDYFDAVQSYIITKPELQRRLITVNSLGLKIVGCPVSIQNNKYDRNALIFNCCFVFDSTARTSRYEPVVKKLASYLTQLELESSILSEESKKSQIPALLSDILNSLNQTGSCSLCLNSSCTVHLKVSPQIEDPKPVQDHDVPMFLSDFSRFTHTHWDLTTQQVLQYIDGYNHVAKIAAEADIEINLVKACLQNLLHIDVITMISVFQYSNMYTTTSQLQQLADDPILQEECLQYVASKSHVKPAFRNVFMLYASLTQGLTVRDLCMRFNPHNLKVDEKRLIQFGLKKNLIGRLHGYPVKLPSETRSIPKVVAISKWLNGNHSLDEISCKSGYTYKELDEMIDNDPSIVVCWK